MNTPTTMHEYTSAHDIASENLKLNRSHMDNDWLGPLRKLRKPLVQQFRPADTVLYNTPYGLQLQAIIHTGGEHCQITIAESNTAYTVPCHRLTVRTPTMKPSNFKNDDTVPYRTRWGTTIVTATNGVKERLCNVRTLPGTIDMAVHPARLTMLTQQLSQTKPGPPTAQLWK